MSVRSGFFNSIGGDRLYDAEDIGNYFDGLISNGIFESIGNRLAVTPGNGLSVNIDTGRAIVNCHWMVNDAVLNLSLAAADVQYKRIDRIVVRLDRTDNNRTVNIFVKKGENALSPVAPALTRTESVYELCLADVFIGANVVSISQSNITDQRINTSLCGFVTGIIKQVDTSDLAIQYQTAFSEYYKQATAEFNAYMQSKKAAFDAWYESLTNTLRVNTTLIKQQYIYETTSDNDMLMVNINHNDEIDYEVGDILLVHIGGVLLVQGIDFDIAKMGDIYYVLFKNIVEKGNTITFLLIKSVIGDSAIYNN